MASPTYKTTLLQPNGSWASLQLNSKLNWGDFSEASTSNWTLFPVWRQGCCSNRWVVGGMQPAFDNCDAQRRFPRNDGRKRNMDLLNQGGMIENKEAFFYYTYIYDVLICFVFMLVWWIQLVYLLQLLPIPFLWWICRMETAGVPPGIDGNPGLHGKGMPYLGCRGAGQGFLFGKSDLIFWRFLGTFWFLGWCVSF